MFYKNKRHAKIQPISQKLERKSGIIVNKNAEIKERDDKDSKQEKSDMQSEGGCS